MVFLEESYINAGHTKSTGWSDDSKEGLFQIISKGQRLSGDSHHEMNGTNYENGQNKPIVFLEESYINAGYTKSTGWSDDSKEGLFQIISKGQRLSGDCHHEMNGTNYEKWLSTVADDLIIKFDFIVNNDYNDKLQDYYLIDSRSQINVYIRTGDKL
ncbi:hypothetical protein FQR65_LT14915 [Abscondita terminalis]|nr:hypothetical protein FQR65_LT14915 [Abscondita terminalis]